MRTPIVTILLIIINIGVYFLVQPFEINAGTDFTFETAAIPDEITSGAVAGVMGAYLVWFPWARIKTLAIIVLLNLKAWMVLAFWFASQFFIAPNSGVAWLAHVGGFVFGAIIAALARGSEGFRQQLWEHKYMTLNPGAAVGDWDPRFGGREVLADGHTPSWHPGS